MLNCSGLKKKLKKIDKRYKAAEGQHPKLLISFNILKENFNPKYIERLVVEFIGEIHDYKEKRLLKYIALLNSFDLAVQLVPLSCFNPIMCPSKGKKLKPLLEQRLKTRGDTYWEASLSKSLNVLLNRTSKFCFGTGVNAVRIINSRLSRTILDKLRLLDQQDVSDVMLEFLHCDIFKKCNASAVQEQLIKIVKTMLKTRAVVNQQRQDFAPLIQFIIKDEGYENAAEVLKSGFSVFEDPMIAQQIARLYLRHQKWNEAEEYAKTALDMEPKNSYLCDTYGQVFKRRLVSMWNECVGSIRQIEGDKAKEIVQLAFRAIEIFRDEQKMSDSDYKFDYNNCGFTSELGVMATLLDICIFLGPFCQNKDRLRKFLISESYVPEKLTELLGLDNINKLKKLYHEYEIPLRRLEDEGIQLKADHSFQDSPSHSGYIQNCKASINLRIHLLGYFGEDTDRVPFHLSEEQRCEYRRRRVKRKGGFSLFSTQEMKETVDKCEMHSMIMENIKSEFCNAYDLEALLNLTVSLISDRVINCADRVINCGMQDVLKWTQMFYDFSKESPRPQLEAFLYLVMFNWPTEWRKEQHFHLCPGEKLKEVIKKWKHTFFEKHPAQSRDRKKPDQRKATTLFFLGQGTEFEEIAFYNDFRNLEESGQSIWNLEVVHQRLQLLEGVLSYGGHRVVITIHSANGEATELSLATSFPISDAQLWQKRIYFFLGFSWSGPKAFGVRIDRLFDVSPRETFPSAASISKRSIVGPTAARNSYDTMASVHSEDDMFFRNLTNIQRKLHELEKKEKLFPTKAGQDSFAKQRAYLETTMNQLIKKRKALLEGLD